MPLAVLPISVIANAHDTSDAYITAISTSNYEVGTFIVTTAFYGTYFQSNFSYIAISL